MKKEVYQCDRCGTIGEKTAFSGDRYSVDGWLQATATLHYCPACAKKYEAFMKVDKEEVK